ncbi:MAG: MATE family efflux transporter [Planctomycetes bacterium]|nr:MATE family efflux transporter [Planctomycetota bacterium]
MAWLIKDSRLARHVLFFGLPLVLGLACHALFNLVDTLLVGQLGAIEGAHAISVTGLCDPITTFQTILFNGPIAGAGVLLAKRHGMNDDEGVRRVIMRASGFVIALSLAMGVPGFIWAQEIATAMGAQAGWQLEQCTEYLKVMLGGGVTAGMFLYLTTVERSLGRTGVFLTFFMLSNLLNAGLGVFLVYGGGPYPSFIPGFVQGINQSLNVPRLGVIGSAWSTVAARAIAGLLILGFGLWKGHMRGKLSWLWPKGKTVMELVRIGLWNNGQVAARGIAGGIMIRSLQEAGGGNPHVVGGIFIGLKIELLLILLSFGWGAAAQTLVATSLGAGKPDRANHEERLAVVFATAFGVALTVPLFLFSREIAQVFNPEPELVGWAETYVRMMAIAFVFVPVNIVISQAMVSRNRLKTPVIIDSIVLLGIMSPVMIIAALSGASVKSLVVVNVVVNIALTLIYVGVRLWVGRLTQPQTSARSHP